MDKQLVHFLYNNIDLLLRKYKQLIVESTNNQQDADRLTNIHGYIAEDWDTLWHTPHFHGELCLFKVDTNTQDDITGRLIPLVVPFAKYRINPSNNNARELEYIDSNLTQLYITDEDKRRLQQELIASLQQQQFGGDGPEDFFNTRYDPIQPVIQPEDIIQFNESFKVCKDTLFGESCEVKLPQTFTQGGKRKQRKPKPKPKPKNKKALT